MTHAAIRLRGLAAALAASLPGAAMAQMRSPSPHLGGGGDVDVSLGRIVASLVVCIIIAALAILLLRQRKGRIDLRGFLSRIEARAQVIHVVETRRLNPQADACVLRHGGREYLLILQPGACQVLSDRALADAGAPAEETA